MALGSGCCPTSHNHPQPPTLSSERDPVPGSKGQCFWQLRGFTKVRGRKLRGSQRQVKVRSQLGAVLSYLNGAFSI